MRMNLIVATLCLVSLNAAAASKCLITKVNGPERTQKEIVINQDNMQITESAGALQTRIEILHGRLITLSVQNKITLARSSVPMNTLAESGEGALAVEDLKTQSALEVTCKMLY